MTLNKLNKITISLYPVVGSQHGKTLFIGEGLRSRIIV